MLLKAKEGYFDSDLKENQSQKYEVIVLLMGNFH